MIDIEPTKSSFFASIKQVGQSAVGNDQKPLSYWIDILVKVIGVSFLILSLSSVLSASEDDTSLAFGASPDHQVIIHIQTDDFPEETSWRLINGNDYETYFSSSGTTFQPNQLYIDTVYVDTSACIQFIIEDTKGDGFTQGGYYEIFFNQKSITSGVSFQKTEHFFFNCTAAQSCNTPKRITKGSFILEHTNSWYLIKPIFDTYYSVRTISDCDTKIWLYDNCDLVHPTDQSGTIAFNDDIDDKQAGLNQVLLKGGETYYLRIGEESSCLGQSMIILTDLELRAGCMDSNSCNFDPLANLDSGDCEYGDCHPDLIINKQVLEESLRLDRYQQNNECLIVEGCLQGYGLRDIIRFTTQIENVGDADYIVGSPEEDSRLFSEDNCHQHWHYLGYAEYLLFDGDGQPQPVGFKNGFCALDYRCEEEEDYKYNCDYMGISAGCSDTYDSDYLCQWIDVTEIEAGVYTLVVRVNHNQAKDLFGRRELDYENNWAQLCIELKRDNGELTLDILESCPTYTDCLNVPFGSTHMDCQGVCGGSAHYGDIDGDGTATDTDVLLYRLKMKDNDLPVEPCFDLDGSHSISIYDLVLLDDCVQNNLTLESDPLHTHCDFPKSIVNISDTISLILSEDYIAASVLQVDYISNTDFYAADFYISHIKIDSVKILIEGLEIEDLSHDNHIMFHVNDPKLYISKSTFQQPLLQIYYSEDDLQDICLSNNFEAINSKKEKTTSTYLGSCLEAITTSISGDNEQTELAVYPNPATTYLALSLPFEGDAIIEIKDQLGREVWGDRAFVYNGYSMDIEALPKGLYVLQLTSKYRGLSTFFIKM